MEEKMVAGAFGRARNYGLDRPFILLTYTTNFKQRKVKENLSNKNLVDKYLRHENKFKTIHHKCYDTLQSVL